MRQTQNAQKKDNRKSIFVIGLLLLLVAVIGFGGYTLSKYVTKKNASGSASVAKWGFTVSADAKNLFGKEYKWDGTNSTVNAEGDKVTVKANTSAGNIVAPGTTGSMTFTIKGSAEVKAKVAINMTVTKDVVLKYTATGDAAAKEYKPVKWTLKKNSENVVGAVGVDLATIKTKLDAVADYAAGSADINDVYTIEWAWDFDANGAGTNDALDTLLGWKASNTVVPDGYGYAIVDEGTNTTIDFALDISITQVKE